MQKRKIISLMLVLILAITLTVPAFSADTEAGAEILTRGSFLAALYGLNGERDAQPRQQEFADVPAEGALAQAIRWAVDNSIVNGYGDGRFGPDDPVTREQMAAMLYRNAQALGWNQRRWPRRTSFLSCCSVGMRR